MNKHRDSFLAKLRRALFGGKTSPAVETAGDTAFPSPESTPSGVEGAPTGVASASPANPPSIAAAERDRVVRVAPKPRLMSSPASSGSS